MMHTKPFWILAALVLVLVGGGILLKLHHTESFSGKKSLAQNTVSTIMAPPPTTAPSTIPSPTQTSTQVTPTTTSPVTGGPQGQIACDYQIPAVGYQDGTAQITAKWNNLVLGKNNTAKAEVCVSVNATPSLMSIDTTDSGSRVDSAPWILLNTAYIFKLFDEHGGDLPDCQGIVLATCQVGFTFPTATPTP